VRRKLSDMDYSLQRRPRGKPSAVNIYDYQHLGEGPAIP
jgi:hypothetical protein